MDLGLNTASPCDTWADESMMGPNLPTRRQRKRKSRGRGLRTKDGCLTCRKRHMKCDEAKPTCGPCAKKDKICDYASTSCPSIVPTATDRPNVETIQGLSTTHQPPSPEQDNGNEPDDLNPIPDHLEPPETSNYTWAASQQDVIPSQSPEAFHGDYVSPSTASLAAVRWFGLLVSGIPSDGQLPSVIPTSWEDQSLSLGYGNGDGPDQASSLQRATQVLDSPPESANSHGVTNDHGTESRALTEEQIWQSREPIELSPAEQKLFEHFITQVSPWIDLFDPTNKFSTLVAHLALRNAGLLNAILALAFRHLALNPRLDDEAITSKPEAAIQYYYQTLHYVRRAMQYPTYKTSLELLSTALIISAYEMLDNSTNDWEHHLEGVFLIQRSQTIHGETGGLPSAVWWAWLCQDIWAAFRERRKTLTFWVPQKPLSTLLPHELATRSIYITAKVVSYCATITTEVNIYRQINEASRLRSMLEDWRRHLSVEFTPLPLGSRDDSSFFRPIWIRPPEFAIAVQFFSVSCLLLMSHEPSLGGLQRLLERQREMMRYVDDICGIAMTLKDNASCLMSSQALFIAGIYTQETHTRMAIIGLLEACRERSGWPVKPLGVELQQIWEKQDSI